VKKRKLFGNDLKEQLQASRRDRMDHFMLADNTIRGLVVNGTRMINEMRWNHQLGILETLVLGQAYLGAALMSAGLKGYDRLTVQVDCSGPIKGLCVGVNAFGEVRGYLKQVPIPIDKPLESFNLSPFFGAGFLSVTKYLEDAKQPFTGKIMLEHGRLAKDLALYHLKSEQIHTAFALSVVFDKVGEVSGAGGLMLQAMPGAQDNVLDAVEQKVAALASLGEQVNRPNFPDDWLDDNFGEFEPLRLHHRGVEFMCHCNRKAIGAMLLLLKPEELEDMAANGPFPIQIRCHHCNTNYDFARKDIKALWKERIATH
jgi:molecular chaperone Hsp33